MDFQILKKQLPNLLKLIAIAIVVKLCYYAFAVSLFQTHLVPDTLDKRYVFSLELFKRNDSSWYEKIYNDGYEKLNEQDWYTIDTSHAQIKWAFFPMYPLTVKATALVLQTDFTTAGFINAILFSIFCYLVFYFLAYDYFQDDKKAFYISILFIIFPFHYYFSMLYSEALFAFLIMSCFLALKHRKYFFFMLFSMALVLTRVNGIIMMLPMLLFLLEQEKIIEQFKINLNKIDTKLILKCTVFLAMLLSFAAYCYYQKQLTGTYFAFSRAQNGWWRELKMPYASFFARGDLQSQFNSIYVISFLILAIIGFKKLPLSYNVLIWISMLLPLISGATLSMQRFIIIIFPFMILIGDFIYTKMPKWKNIILVLLFFLQLSSFYYWVIGDPFSY